VPERVSTSVRESPLETPVARPIWYGARVGVRAMEILPRNTSSDGQHIVSFRAGAVDLESTERLDREFAERKRISRPGVLGN